jgi:hypothetical protein
MTRANFKLEAVPVSEKPMAYRVEITWWNTRLQEEMKTTFYTSTMDKAVNGAKEKIRLYTGNAMEYRETKIREYQFTRDIKVAF